ncbi:BolA family protein [Anaplasma bovis]|uniref:BolA family protein n=1 Tax=Anaplasma bovis TaxID=186733 RepID=UPI002FEFE6B7
MAVEFRKLKAVLDCAFPDGEVIISPLVEDDEHYSVRIISKKFAGKSRVAQHRMVYDALSGIDIHALQIQTYVGSSDE